MYPPQIAATTPEKIAYIMAGSGNSLTYRELDETSNRLARWLRSHQVSTGDTLLIVMENRVEWPVVVAAGMRSGLYVTPVNWHLKSAELRTLIAAAKPAAVITSPLLAEVVAEAIGDDTVHLLCTGEGAPEMETFHEAISAHPATPVADEQLGARVLFSGGSTGLPKAFRQKLLGIHPADAPARHGELMAKLGLSADTVMLSPAPNYHAAPFTFQLAALSAGATVVCLERFDAGAALQAISDYEVTLSQWVPTMLIRLVDYRATHDVTLPPTHRAAVTSGGPCSVETKQNIDAWWGPVLHEYYGASEGYGHTYISPLEARDHAGSVGRPLGGASIHIADDDGNDCEPGAIGTVWFEPAPTQRYVNDADSTGPRDGWKSMGDLGCVDEDGFLYLKGRKGFTIVSGGVNIYPEEVERVLQAHPSVRDVAVLGAPDAEFGEHVVAVVEAAAEADLATIEADLVRHAKAELATFKAPKRVVVLDELPRLPTGKLNKVALKEAVLPAQ